MENSSGTARTATVAEVAVTLAADLDRIMRLYRALTPPGGLSLTAVATLAAIEGFGPQRLTALAASEGVTQPAMTQLISRLEEAGLARRESHPDDGRVVLVTITDEGRSTLAHRRLGRSVRLAAVLSQLSPEHLAALSAAHPALEALVSVPRDEEPPRNASH
jgi:DNA-binding MarR family transcriptional regulator